MCLANARPLPPQHSATCGNMELSYKPSRPFKVVVLLATREREAAFFLRVMLKRRRAHKDKAATSSALPESASSLDPLFSPPVSPVSESPPQLSMEQAAQFLVVESESAASDAVAMLAAAAGLPSHKAADDAAVNMTCGPHFICCGGFYNQSENVFTPCRKRLTGHGRGTVCLNTHHFEKCCSCNNVLHCDCWLPNRNGSYVLVQQGSPFTCADCERRVRIKARSYCVHTIVIVKQAAKPPGTVETETNVLKREAIVYTQL